MYFGRRKQTAFQGGLSWLQPDWIFLMQVTLECRWYLIHWKRNQIKLIVIDYQQDRNRLAGRIIAQQYLWLCEITQFLPLVYWSFDECESILFGKHINESAELVCGLSKAICTTYLETKVKLGKKFIRGTPSCLLSWMKSDCPGMAPNAWFYHAAVDSFQISLTINL